MKRVQKQKGCDIRGNTLTLDDVRSRMIGKKYIVTTTCEFFPELSGMVVNPISALIARNGEVLIQCLSQRGRALSIGTNMKDLVFHECTCYDGCT